ncbi:LuxR C-terminal-related transcriptional regulator [Nocardioides koreensis]|uniref:LuxR C-terminal-related transcriptional regulator n=1 Tax=Nocardioides koreensis TaxID=433651 RepID=A0ABN2Z332_9ACTN
MQGRDAGVAHGREAYADAAWLDASAHLSRADEALPLDPPDLELLATAWYMLADDAAYAACLERAHHGYLAAGDDRRAVRCAFWIGHNRLFRGDPVHAGGWFARAHRILGDQDCVEAGYLLIPVWLREMASGDFERGHATAVRGEQVGERFGDLDLTWLARDDQARALLNLGRVEEGLRLVDEAMLAATSQELSPIVTGILYCNTLAFCQDSLEVDHARAWMLGLVGWCDGQPAMVEHNGLCQVHRAEVLELEGAWADALDAAEQAADRFDHGVLNQLASGRARYRQGEIHRLRGDLDTAEQAFREANALGYEPQPGLALLRLEQGDSGAAAATIRRVLRETVQRLPRARLLPAFVQIMLAAGEQDDAVAASTELDDLARLQGTSMLRAQAAYAVGAVSLAGDDPGGALVALRRALNLWLGLAAPYEVARTRVLIALACRALGDEETATMEQEAARLSFNAMGARADAARLDARRARRAAAGLTGREVEVLRLVAAGRSNREIATELQISEHTVARHVQNILGKVGASSRTAASAFAHHHGLV